MMLILVGVIDVRDAAVVPVVLAGEKRFISISQKSYALSKLGQEIVVIVRICRIVFIQVEFYSAANFKIIDSVRFIFEPFVHRLDDRRALPL